MVVAGFNFTKNDFRFSVLNGSTNPPSLIEKDKIVLPKDLGIAELMEWFDSQLSLIIDKHKPDQIAHKISLNLSTLAQIRASCYPQGILNLVARRNKIPINSYSAQGINATKFGQPKKTDVYKHMDSIIGTHPPYWDKPTKDAVLVAWFNLI